MRKQDIDLCAMEREYIAGASTYELGEKYGVRHETVSKWMRGLGHCRGRRQGDAFEKSRKLQGEEALARFTESFADMYRGEIEYVGGFGGGDAAATFRCCRCGRTWERKRPRDVLRMHMSCPACKERERLARSADRERRRAEWAAMEQARKKRRAEAEAKRKRIELGKAKVRRCRTCGREFNGRTPDALYCSSRCQRRRPEQGDHRHRAKVYGTEFDPTVTINALIERDGTECAICGRECSFDDREYGSVGRTYPTIDHIFPMSKGGSHVWSNVQVACFECNAKKSDSVPR